jgi:tetratricopeptide (TPR) repeat protein
VAQIVWCYRDLGEIEHAGQTFLQVLLAGDSGTQYFDCIPLAWTTGLPAPSLERAAAGWLASTDSPAAVLLGASHLLGTAQGPAALDRLKRMTTDRDRRLAWLAQAQVWRATTFQASEEQLLGYLQAIDDCPSALRAGPYFVIGSALVKFRPNKAALTLLRLPILYPRERQLASAGLLAAGGILQRGGKIDEAAHLYQELTRDYGDLADAAEAQRRLTAGRTKP